MGLLVCSTSQTVPRDSFMRVLIANSSFGVGGFSSFAINMAKGFRRAGHIPTSLVYEQSGATEGEFREAFDGVFEVGRRLETADRWVRRIATTINELRPDLLINNTRAPVQAALPYLDEHILAVSVVHSIGPIEVATALAHSEYQNGIVAVSENIASTIRAGREVGVDVIPVGCVVPSLPRSPRTGAFQLLYVGRLVTEKNVHMTIEILEEVVRRGIDARLTIVGAGPTMPNLQRRAASSSCRDLVTFVGQVIPSEVDSWYASSDALLLTSTYEGSPHAIIEAMSRGVVPICSRIPGSTDRMIEHGLSGYLCDTFEPLQYAESVVSLATSPSTFSALRNGAHARALALYSIDAVVRRYLDSLPTWADGSRNRIRRIQPGHRVPIPLALQGQMLSLPRQAKHLIGRQMRRLSRAASS